MIRYSMAISIVALSHIFLVWSQLILPIKKMSDLGSVFDHHLSCHNVAGWDLDDKKYSMKIRSVHPTFSQAKIKGHLCKRTKHVVYCDRGFFGGDDLTKYALVIKPTVSDCQEAIRDWKANREETLEAVLPDCAWMRKTATEQVIFDIREKELIFDSYNARVVDDILDGGSCSDIFCNTRYEGIIWVADKPLETNCPKVESSIAHINFGDTLHVSSISVSSDYIPEVSLEGSCQGFNYCQNEGYILRTGHFLLKSPDIPPNITSVLNTLPQCAPDASITGDTYLKDLQTMKLNIERLFRVDRCNQVINQIRERKPISFYEMGFLNPGSIGISNGYIYTDKGLRVGLYRYVLATSYTVKCPGCLDCSVIVKTNSGSYKIENEVFRCNCTDKKYTCSLPNGILLNRTELYHPFSDLELELYNDMIDIKRNTNYIEHPFVKVGTSNRINKFIENTISNSSSISKTVKESVSGFFSSIGEFFEKGLISIAIFLVCAIGTLLLMKWLITGYCKNKHRRPHGHKGIELRSNPENNDADFHWGVT